MYIQLNACFLLHFHALGFDRLESLGPKNSFIDHHEGSGKSLELNTRNRVRVYGCCGQQATTVRCVFTSSEIADGCHRGGSVILFMLNFERLGQMIVAFRLCSNSPY
jgi:hypothetical protein